MSDYKPTPIVRSEMNRIISLIPETDPRTREYGLVLESLERLLAISGTLDEIVREYPPEESPHTVINFSPPTSEEDKFEEPLSSDSIADEGVTAEDLAPVEEEVKYDVATVKKAIQDARMAGKLTSAKEWIRDEFKVDGFTAIPASMYGQVMAKLKELGV